MTHDLSRPHYCHSISVTASLSDGFVVSLENSTSRHNSGTDVAVDRLALATGLPLQRAHCRWHLSLPGAVLQNFIQSNFNVIRNFNAKINEFHLITKTKLNLHQN